MLSSERNEDDAVDRARARYDAAYENAGCERRGSASRRSILFVPVTRDIKTWRDRRAPTPSEYITSLRGDFGIPLKNGPWRKIQRGGSGKPLSAINK